MKIAKPLLITTTSIGLVGGLYDAWKLVGGLTFLIVAMLGVLGFAAGSIVMTIRREERARGEEP